MSETPNVSPSPNTSSTLDPPGGVPLYLRRDGDDFHITDVVGVRYGHGQTLMEAMRMWAEDVDWLCKEPSDTIGGALLREQTAYRQALRYSE